MAVSKTGKNESRVISTLQAPEPEVLKAIEEEAQRAGTDAMTSREIDRIIRAARGRRGKVRKRKSRD